MQDTIGTLIVVVLKAKDLNDKHSFSKQDVFAQVTLDKETEKTNVDIKGGQHPVWDSEFRMPISPDASEKTRTLHVSCWSKELREDDCLGEGTVDITNTLKTGEFDDWVPLSLNGTTRGEVYLEMTYYANGPAPASTASANLMRRPSKWAPSERLARPVYYTPPSKSQSPHRNSGQYLSPPSGTTPPSSKPNSRASSASPRGRNSPLPPVPDIPEMLTPGSHASQLSKVPTVLRPGNPKSNHHSSSPPNSRPASTVSTPSSGSFADVYPNVQPYTSITRPVSSISSTSQRPSITPLYRHARTSSAGSYHGGPFQYQGTTQSPTATPVPTILQTNASPVLRTNPNVFQQPASTYPVNNAAAVVYPQNTAISAYQGGPSPAIYQSPATPYQPPASPYQSVTTYHAPGQDMAAGPARYTHTPSMWPQLDTPASPSAGAPAFPIPSVPTTPAVDARYSTGPYPPQPYPPSQQSYSRAPWHEERPQHQDLPDPYLRARYQSPLPLPPGSVPPQSSSSNNASASVNTESNAGPSTSSPMQPQRSGTPRMPGALPKDSSLLSTGEDNREPPPRYTPTPEPTADEIAHLEAVRLAEENRRRQQEREEEARRKEEEQRLREEEEEIRRKEEEARRREEEAVRREEEARRREEAARQKEEEVRRREEAARKREEEVKRLEAEARKREEEARKREEEVRRRAEEARRREMEQRRRQEEARRREQGLRRMEEEARKIEEEERQQRVEQEQRDMELARQLDRERQEQEERDMELARKLDRELNVETVRQNSQDAASRSGTGRRSSSNNIPGRW